MVVNPADNAENLPPDYLESPKNLPERMRRRFYDGKFTADDDNALWRRAWIKRDSLDEYGRIVVALDPAMTNKPGSDETGSSWRAEAGISAVMCWRMTAASIGRKNGPPSDQPLRHIWSGLHRGRGQSGWRTG